MNDIKEFITNFWTKNESGGKKPVSFLQQVSDKTCTNIFIGYNEIGNRCLFLKTDNNSIPKLQYEKTNISLKASNTNKLVYIELHDLYFGEIFDDLICSIFFNLKNIPIKDNLTYFISIFKKWNELFKTYLGNNLLSENELLGLIGELTYLKYRLNQVNDQLLVNKILDSWSGPDGNTNDFVFDDINIEIKTIDFQRDYINISSEFQLSTSNKPLNLIVYKTTQTYLGISLVDIIADIREIINQKFGSTEKFLFKINSFHLDFKNTSYYTDYKVVISEPIIYNVKTSEFPRVVMDNLIKGVFGVKYKITLNSLEPFRA